MILNDSLANAQSETCSLLFGRIKWGKYLSLILFKDSNSFIRYFNLHHALLQPGGKRNFSSLLHGFQRVFRKIQENLLEFGSVSLDKDLFSIRFELKTN